MSRLEVFDGQSFKPFHSGPRKCCEVEHLYSAQTATSGWEAGIAWLRERSGTCSLPRIKVAGRRWPRRIRRRAHGLRHSDKVWVFDGKD